MAMEEGLDTGPVLLERRLAIPLLQNAGQLSERLARLTGELLVEALPLIEAAGAGPEPERLARLGVRPQAGDGISYARQLTKEDTLVDWGASALAIHRRVMGLHPNASCPWGAERLKLLATEPLVSRLADQLTPVAAALAERWGSPSQDGSAAGGSSAAGPGTVLAVVEGEGLVVATGGCPVLVRQAQLPGRRPSAGQALIQQLGLAAGDPIGANTP
jgi:methionyl-tRNA formyltransferase